MLFENGVEIPFHEFYQFMEFLDEEQQKIN